MRPERLALAGMVRTLDPSRPIAGGVVADGGCITELTAAPGALHLPAGAVVVPGFEDPHVHLLAMAAGRRSVDCSAAVAPDLDAFAAVLVAGARRGQGWLRAVGFDDALVAERRPPDRHLLDRAVPGRPLVVHHSVGVVAWCNSEALRRLGVDPDRGDGTDGVERDRHGRATGAVAERSPVLGAVPALDPGDLRAAFDETASDLLAAGVTAVTDATATNDQRAVDLLATWAGDAPAPRVSLMLAATIVSTGPVTDLSPVRLGHAKCIVEGDDPEDLDEVVARCRARGWPVALHVTDVDTLDRALHALGASPPASRADRLEHVSLCLPEQVAQVAASGAVVVTHPAFVERRRAKYAEQLSDVEHRWLYRVRSLLDAGVTVAAASDAPVLAARPMESVAAAVVRELNPDERVDAATALALVTRGAAAASGDEGGVLRLRGPADFVVLGADPLSVDTADLAAIPVLATVVAGRVVYRSSELAFLA